jgi:hypothetical protein
MSDPFQLVDDDTTKSFGYLFKSPSFKVRWEYCPHDQPMANGEWAAVAWILTGALDPDNIGFSVAQAAPIISTQPLSLVLEGVTLVSYEDEEPLFARYVDWQGAMSQLGITGSWLPVGQ